jgi:hypothetical protein
MGCCTQAEWKLIYGIISLVSKVISFIIAIVLDQNEYSDMIDLAVGCVFLSSGFVHIMPRASSQVRGGYPFSSLIAISVFAVLTLFCFIRDSIALMDENILTTCDTVTYHGGASPDAAAEGDGGGGPLAVFVWADQIPTLALYFAVLAETIATSIWVATLDVGGLREHTAVILVMNFLEFIGVAKFVVSMPMPNFLYWLMTVIAAGVPSILIACPLGSCSGAKAAAGYVSSCLLGLYLFMGSIAVHSGLAQTRRHVAVVCAVLLLAFTIPAAIRAGDR